jgi:muramoyltetrapeptide carboxypeptidase
MLKHLTTILIIICSITIHNSISASNKLIKPAYLKVGDTLAIVAPAGILKNQQAIEEAVKLVEAWGLHVVLGKHLFGNNFHFSGTENERIEDFQTALDAKNIKAIWCARGGYGTVRIIDDLDFTEFKKKPKWIIGYSDITVLHSHIHNLGYETLHAMMPVNMNIDKKKRAKTVKTFKKALFGKSLSYKIKTSAYNKFGVASGQLVGGNLSILQSLLGSVSSINTNGKILFFEDVGEYLYHIDRMVYALKRSDYFKNCNGIIIGEMTNIKKNSKPFGQTVEEIVLEATKVYNFPILFGFPAGHDATNKALILGRKIELNVHKKNSTVKFSN